MLVIAHMSRGDIPNSHLFRKDTTDFSEKSYNISETKNWFRMGGWDKSGEYIAEKVATSVFGGWCVEGVFAGQYGK